MVKKRVAVFIDSSAQKALKWNVITPQEILMRVTEIYKLDSLPFSYDLENLDIEDWYHSENILDIFTLSTNPLITARMMKIAQSKKRNLNNVNLFMTGDLTVGCGCVDSQSLERGNGGGLIFLGTGEYDCSEYLRSLALVLAHEQAHLFGIRHSVDLTTIMCSDAARSNGRFDKNSIKELLKKLS